jgi:hypothetical protein
VIAPALCLFSLLFVARCRTTTPVAQDLTPFPPREMVALIQQLSEPGGRFFAENLVSNETSYLHVAEMLGDRVSPGGVYLGVGPDQNFNYMARLKPRWAFILDIRRQNLLQHLMFNALFTESEDAYQYLCRLLSRPCPARTPPGALANVAALLDAVEQEAPTRDALSRNEARVLRHVQERLGFPLTAEDRSELSTIQRSFFENQLEIRFRGSFRPSWLRLPTYRELLLERSPSGRFGHYLADREDYAYLRELQRAGRVVPVVGDFAGPHALKAIGQHLKVRGESVSAFYLSNVEFYLFRNGVFDRFIENVRELPLRAPSQSVIIRACFGFGRPHPEAVPGYISVTLLQPIPRFIEMGERGRYTDDWDVCTLDYLTNHRTD